MEKSKVVTQLINEIQENKDELYLAIASDELDYTKAFFIDEADNITTTEVSTTQEINHSYTSDFAFYIEDALQEIAERNATILFASYSFKEGFKEYSDIENVDRKQSLCDKIEFKMKELEDTKELFNTRGNTYDATLEEELER